MTRIIIKSVLLALIISLVVSTRPASAYIDPNTGGLLFQMLATAFALFSGILLLFSRQIRMAFARAMRSLRSLLNRDSLIAKDAQTHSQHRDAQGEDR